MITFFLRRFLTSALVVFISTFIMYVLVDIAIDPLEKFRASSSPNRAAQMQNLSDRLNLDEPVTSRYLDWIQGVLGCTYGSCDLGSDWERNQEVTHLLGGAIITTLQLVSAATVLAILIGIVIGLVSALRQYTGFDYGVTFMMFLLYSLPIFVVAVLLKYFLAIDFNDFLTEDPGLGWSWIGAGALVTGVVMEAALGGSVARRLRVFGVTAGVVALVGWYVNARQMLVTPSEGGVLDMLVVAVLSVGAALLVTELSTGISNRRALGAALTVAGIGIGLYYPLLYLWVAISESWPLMFGLLAVAIGVGMLVGWLWGGPDRGRSARTAALTAIPVSAFLFIDRLMQSWAGYVDNGRIRGRPIATVGPSTPELQGSFWVHTIDTFTHLLLPTVTLVLISLATYTRYIRASTLDVLNQDYIRTARSKGLTERTVVMRHAVRNALLPLAAVVPIDIITLVGGAIITETVFGWHGMGALFIHALDHNIQDPVMGYILIVGIFAVVANFLADLCYAVLDPRIRVAA